MGIRDGLLRERESEAAGRAGADVKGVQGRAGVELASILDCSLSS